MNKDELIVALRKIRDRQNSNNSDVEVDHTEADNLLLSFINDDDISTAFGEIDKWYA